MATLDYIDVPLGATPLLPTSDPLTDIQPLPKITTSIPHPSPPPSPTTSRSRRPSLFSSASSSSSSSASSAGAAVAGASLTSPTLSFLPQLLLSASLPPISPGSTSTTPTLPNPPPNPRRRRVSGGFGGYGGSGSGQQEESITLLSSRDPLSLPIMSTNFRRFVSIVGPVFWFQDRVEEVLLWKRGWMRTAVWMAAYAFLCFYPRVILLLPHIILIGIILSTYPYQYHLPPNPNPNNPNSRSKPMLYTLQRDPDELPSTTGTTSAPPPPPPPPPPVAPEGSVPWQANIQGIQNLMGAVADAHAVIEPYIHHLVLTPQHVLPPARQHPTSSSSTTTSSSSSTTSSHPPYTHTNTYTSKYPYSPYPPHILTVLVLSFLILLCIVHLPIFPVREVCLFAGLGPVVGMHPGVRRVGGVLWRLGVRGRGVGRGWAVQWGWARLRGWVKGRVWFLKRRGKGEKDEKAGKAGEEKKEDEREATQDPPIPLRMSLQRLLDDDRLTDACWNAEMREVQLWENERYVGPLAGLVGSSSSFTSSAGGGGDLSLGGSGAPPGGSGSGITGGSGGGGPGQRKGWSKANLRPGERAGWTRGRDGWSGAPGGGVLGGTGGEGVGVGEGVGEVSNLTFSLAPGWRFVETEDWRKDLQCAWSGCGGDADGWVYTNDAWLGPRPAPYTAGGGSVTRRRRWVRRVWFDPGMLEGTS